MNNRQRPELSEKELSRLERFMPKTFFSDYSKTVLYNPFTTKQGHTFEERELNEFLQNGSIDPLDGTRIEREHVKHDNKLKTTIDEWFINILPRIKDLLTMQELAQELINTSSHPSSSIPPNIKADLRSCKKYMPSTFFSALSDKLLVNPHTTIRGLTYEKSEIDAHLLHSNNDPVDNKPLTIDQVKLDSKLKETIDDWRENIMPIIQELVIMENIVQQILMEADEKNSKKIVKEKAPQPPLVQLDPAPDDSELPLRKNSFFPAKTAEKDPLLKSQNKSEAEEDDTLDLSGFIKLK